MENSADRTAHTGCFLLKVEIKYYNVMIDGQNFFDQPVKSSLRTYDNIRKIRTGQKDDCTTGFLLDYTYFKKHYQMMEIDLSKKTSRRCRSKSNTTN